MENKSSEDYTALMIDDSLRPSIVQPPFTTDTNVKYLMLIADAHAIAMPHK